MLRNTLPIAVFFVYKLVFGCALYIGDYCTDTDTGASGQCVLLPNCPNALQELQRGKFPQTCGFDGTVPIVCCRGIAPQIPVSSTTPSTTTRRTTTRTTTTTPRTTRTTTRAPTDTSVRGPRNPGEISQLKCREYGQYVYQKVIEPTLLLDAEPVLKYECGTKAIKLIVGGEPASEKEFPHMTAVGFEPTPGDIHWDCGGSLISERFVLTAGHCLKSRDLGDAKYAKLGVINLKSQYKLQQLKIIELIKHPDYKSSSHYNDIGLLKLEEGINLNPFVRPACLLTTYNIPTEHALATGWGRTMFGGDTSVNLLKVKLKFVVHDQCNSSYKSQINRKLRNGIVDDSQLCAGAPQNEQEKDSCQGDSGGPLQNYHPATDVKCMYDVVGIVSFGQVCGIGDSPGVYTRVSNYIKWIEDIVWP